MLKVLTKADLILLVVLILLGLGMSFISVYGSQSGSTLRVTVDDQPYGTYDLGKDQEVVVQKDGHFNKFSIKDGHVQMDEASCKNKVCIHQGAVSRSGQTIVCLPNKVMLQVEGGEGYDAVSN